MTNDVIPTYMWQEDHSCQMDKTGVQQPGIHNEILIYAVHVYFICRLCVVWIAFVSPFWYPIYCRVNAPEKEAPWTEKEKIRVCVRKRPLGLKEERRGELNVVTVEDRDTLLLHEKKEAVDLTQYVLQVEKKIQSSFFS